MNSQPVIYPETCPRQSKWMHASTGHQVDTWFKHNPNCPNLPAFLWQSKAAWAILAFDQLPKKYMHFLIQCLFCPLCQKCWIKSCIWWVSWLSFPAGAQSLQLCRTKDGFNPTSANIRWTGSIECVLRFYKHNPKMRCLSERRLLWLQSSYLSDNINACLPTSTKLPRRWIAKIHSWPSNFLLNHFTHSVKLSLELHCSQD